MTAVMLSRVIGYVREAYIAYAFGAGPATDAYVAGFTIPDWLNYLVAGGTASITFVSIYTRFVAANKEDEAQKTFSVIITVMTAVLGSGRRSWRNFLLRKFHAISSPSSALNKWSFAFT